MKEVVILSGKGGTGKTSIVGSFAAIAQNKVMADCDVARKKTSFAAGRLPLSIRISVSSAVCARSYAALTPSPITRLTPFPAKVMASVSTYARLMQLP